MQAIFARKQLFFDEWAEFFDLKNISGSIQFKIYTALHSNFALLINPY